MLIGAGLVHAGNGWLFSAPDGGWEYPAFWVVVMLALALLGDGRYSLARAVGSWPRGGDLSRAAE